MKKAICAGLFCCSLAACSTAPFGPPDNPAEAIPPSRPSPFEENGSGANASPWSGSGIDSADSSSPQASH